MSTEMVMTEKRNVAVSFGRAASSYDTAAHFQRDVGNRLMKLLPEADCEAEEDCEVAVDLGCGTGYFTPLLGGRLNVGQLLGIDLSEGMVTYAREHRPLIKSDDRAEFRGDKKIAWLVGDAEKLPLENGSVDLVFTSLAIQWCDSYSELFKELFRVLKPGGSVVFSTLLDGTLKELEDAWRKVDNYRHVNSFSTGEVITNAVDNAGFEMLECQQYTEVLKYPSVKALTRELKMLGAHNVNEGRPMKVTGRERILAFRQAYEDFRHVDGLLPATYEVFLGSVRKPFE